MRSTYLVLAATLLASAFCSCVSSPQVVETKASLRLMDQQSLKNNQLGLSFNDNPYLEPSKVWGKVDEFVVIRLDLELPATAKVELDVSVTGPDGTSVAEFKNLGIMEYYWSNWAALQEDMNSRNTTLFRSYVPGLSFEGKPGRKSYYLVCLGPKYPLPRPYTVSAAVAIDGAIAGELNETLEPLPPKAKK